MTDIILESLVQETGFEWTREYKFHPTRKWRFDYACPKLRIAIEVNGGNWVSGRHQNPVGLTKEYEKRGEASALSWFVLDCTPPTNRLELMRFGTNGFWDILKRIIESRQSLDYK